jgi:hypothetical protein
MTRGFPRIFDPDRQVKVKRQKPHAAAREALTTQLATPKPRRKRKAAHA